MKLFHDKINNWAQQAELTTQPPWRASGVGDSSGNM
jgi:hypothetical protein